RQGVEPGAVVLVMRELSAQAVVSLLAGLRLGACVSLLEPRGPAYVARRLEAAAPQHICSAPFHDPWLGAMAELRLSPEGIETPLATSSHTYAPDEPCALLFSPLRNPPELPIPLTAARAHLGALRDGTITLALRPGDALAAPGLHREQHQPAMLLSTLCAGATFVHVPAQDVRDDPSLLDAFALRTLGLDTTTCEALLARGGGGSHRWEHVLRNPEEPTDWQAWSELIESRGLSKTAMSNVVFEAASGGALLASPRRPGREHLAALMNVVPAAGQPWTLLDFTQTGQSSPGEAGVYAPAEPAPPEELPPEPATIEPVYIVLGRRRGGEYLYGGTLQPRRSGRVYPTDEVLAALQDCPFLYDASIVAMPAGGATLAQLFVLLGFCGHEPDGRFASLATARKGELMRMLATRLGPDLLPDRIELFPLLPRVSDEHVDHAWCHTQYQTGTLYAKARTPSFARMTELRQLTTR
ncbi:MAG: long-chain fatty acid--CoA ligase, partial [Nannocystaceae bacterium]